MKVGIDPEGFREQRWEVCIKRGAIQERASLRKTELFLLRFLQAPSDHSPLTFCIGRALSAS
jgi:hypothetical protein